MPHFVFERPPSLDALERAVPTEPIRWGRSVLKVEGLWLRPSRPSALAEGVVVELARPLHPVAILAPRRQELVVRLWPLVPVERTHSVQRWLAILAGAAMRAGAGALVSTNVAEELWRDLLESRP
jgi:hypothetical protein